MGHIGHGANPKEYENGRIEGMVRELLKASWLLLTVKWPSSSLFVGMQNRKKWTGELCSWPVGKWTCAYENGIEWRDKKGCGRKKDCAFWKAI